MTIIWRLFAKPKPGKRRIARYVRHELAVIEDFGYAMYARAFNKRTKVWERHGASMRRDLIHVMAWCKRVALGRMQPFDWRPAFYYRPKLAREPMRRHVRWGMPGGGPRPDH